MESAEDGVGVTTGELKICVNIERKGRRKKWHVTPQLSFLVATIQESRVLP